MKRNPEAKHGMALLLATIFMISITTTTLVARAQITTPCMSSMVTSFTPCFNFITGSSGKGNSPTQECCDSFKTMMSTSVECTCLIITAGIPIPLPINRTLAISLPRACNGGVPLQCKAAGTPLPPPGPVLFAPPPPHSPSIAAPPDEGAPSPDTAPSPFSPQASMAAAVTAAKTEPPASAPGLAPESDHAPTDATQAGAPAEPNTGTSPRTSRIQPRINGFSSNSNPSIIPTPPSLVIFLAIVALYKTY